MVSESSFGASTALALDQEERPFVLTDALEPLVTSARAYAANSRSVRTREEYAKQWRMFETWCDEHGVCAQPAAAQTVALYLSARADEGRKVATIALALAAISQAHIVAGYKSPRTHRLVTETWKGIRRRLGVAPDQKQPVSIRDVRAMIETLPRGMLGHRDCALLAIGFADGFRRSELVALRTADLNFVREGVDHLVPLSCKARGLCPSCGGRRVMTLTRHVMDAELPHVPVRQWVLKNCRTIATWRFSSTAPGRSDDRGG